MKVLKPIKISSGMVLAKYGVSGDVAYQSYNPSTTYAKGAQRKVDDDAYDIHMLYESLQDNNTAHWPADNIGTWWGEVKPLPGWELFDESPSTLTHFDLGPWHGIRKISYTIAPGQIIDMLGLINLNQVLRVDVSVVTEQEGLLFETSIDMQQDDGIVDFWTYLTADIDMYTDLAIPLPAAIGEITVTLWGAYDYGLSVGCLLLGKTVALGDTEWGVGLGINDYSTDEVDAWGNARLVKGKFSKRLEVDLELDTYLIDYVGRRLASLRATPALWVGGEFTSMIVYGRYESFKMIIPNPALSSCALTIKGFAQ
jgi:hypothetical protein